MYSRRERSRETIRDSGEVLSDRLRHNPGFSILDFLIRLYMEVGSPVCGLNEATERMQGWDFPE